MKAKKQQPRQTDNVTLHFRQGPSDKVYQAWIEPRAGGFVVTFAFGRRGSTLTTGTKMPAPVAYPAAKKVFDQLVKEKTAKGYTPGEDGTPYQQTDSEDRATGVLPQLLNPIDEAEVEKLIASDAWWMQEKFDGRRLLVRKRGEEVAGINRNGLLVGLPQPVVEAVQGMEAASCLLDGEAAGDVYHAFDLLERDGTDLRPRPYAERFEVTVDLADAALSKHVRYAEVAADSGSKRAMLDQLKQQKKEGVVFKRHDAPYTAGRPASGGTQVKFKFYATASCLVAAVNPGRRSVALELTEGGRRVGVGSVTIPPNKPVPAVGEAVEVRYLYAYAGGCLYQPVYLGRRDDVDPAACGVAQLKYRTESA